MIDERIRIQENYDMTMKQLSMEHVRKVWNKGWNRGRHEVNELIHQDALKRPVTRRRYQMLLVYPVEN